MYADNTNDYFMDDYYYDRILGGKVAEETSNSEKERSDLRK